MFPLQHYLRRKSRIEKRESLKKEKGFTLIELLVVIAIIGILATTAMSRYRRRRFDARAQTDLRNMINAEELHFADNEAYTSDPSSLPGFNQSAGVTVTAALSEGTFIVTAKHSQGTKTFTFNSAAGLFTSD